jgi:phage terminase large subunit
VAELRIKTPEAFAPLLVASRYKGAWGGRGSGKSHFFAELLVEQNIMRRLDAVCIREVQRTLNQSVKKLIEGKIEALNVGDYFEVQDKRIKSRKGGITNSRACRITLLTRSSRWKDSTLHGWKKRKA